MKLGRIVEGGSLYISIGGNYKKSLLDVSDLRPWVAEFAVSALLGWWRGASAPCCWVASGCEALDRHQHHSSKCNKWGPLTGWYDICGGWMRVGPRLTASILVTTHDFDFDPEGNRSYGSGIMVVVMMMMWWWWWWSNYAHLYNGPFCYG